MALAGDHEALADVAVHRLREQLDLRCCAIFERRERALTLVAAAGAAVDAEAVDADAADVGAELAAAGGGVAIVLGLGGRSLGQLSAVPRPGCAPGDDGARLLAAVAAVLTGALERRRRESELRHRSLHDPVTGLPNRALLADRLAVAAAGTVRHPGRLALLCVGLDRFQRVNDTHGQLAGDALLWAVGERLGGAVRPGDTVARLEGDVFAVLCTVDRRERARQVAERLLAELRAPFTVAGDAFVVTGSIGVAVAPPGGAGLDRLLRDADAAMRRAKASGSDRCELRPPPTLVGRAGSAQDPETELRRAIETGGLALAYQPVRDSTDGTVRGVEALVRWPTPEGVRGATRVVPLAEATGLVVPMGEWVLHTACTAARAWGGAGGRAAPELAVNLSARQLAEPDLVERIAGILAETRLPASRLVLEVTETAVLRDAKAAVTALRRLQGLGVVIAIDDFGTGWSSLSSLHRLPVDVLKIDRTFVADLERGRPDGGRAIVAAILELGSTLGLRVIAEGVETEHQLAVLRELGCGEVQGYLLGRPGGPDGVARLLRHPPWPRLEAGGRAPAVRVTRS